MGGLPLRASVHKGDAVVRLGQVMRLMATGYILASSRTVSMRDNLHLGDGKGRHGLLSAYHSVSGAS